MLPDHCPVCGAVASCSLVGLNNVKVECQNCGTFYTDQYLADHPLRDNPKHQGLTPYHVSAWIRDRWRHGREAIIVHVEDVDSVVKNVPFPTPAEKAERLLLTLARMSYSVPGRTISINEVKPSDAWAFFPPELGVYARWLAERHFVQPYHETGSYCLTMEGWLEVDRLRKERDKSRNRAFMAMPFNNPQIESLVTDHFVPAAAQAGFELRKITDGQPAGLIDDQLRVRLRTARFVVADLTDGNQGAYWEAGFAEGLGTPVIYTCEKSTFESLERNRRTHFDTNHLVHVLWEEGQFETAASELKSIIRNTLPNEAKLED